MPTILRLLGFRFFFYSNESNEPVHVHIEKGDAAGKYWLDPVKKDFVEGFNKKEEKQIREIIEEQQDNFKNEWNEYFGQ